MKTTHKILLASAAVIPMLGAGGLVASAATETTNPRDSIIDKLVTKFNLNESEVQSVFDEARSERRSEMEANFNEKISQAVTDGDLTQEQADKITAKRTELESTREANMEAWSDLTHEERHAKMEEVRDEIKTWADENNIEMKWLMPGGGRGHGGMMGGANKEDI